MGIEIERKFLVNPRLFQEWLNQDGAKLLSTRRLRQGYLAKDPWVRVRILDDHDALITIKSGGAPVAMEYEYPIPIVDAREMYDRLCKGKLLKTRRRIDCGGLVWDVDEFHDLPRSHVCNNDHSGISCAWLAEIELKALDQPFSRPPWAAMEVTGDARYSNAVLVQRGFPLPMLDHEASMTAGEGDEEIP